MTGSSALIAFLLCLQGTAEPTTPDAAAETAAADEKLLRERKIGTDGPDLLVFLRQRTLTADDEKRIASYDREGVTDHRTSQDSARATTSCFPRPGEVSIA